MTKPHTQAALCAAAIRKELKAEGIKASVTSVNFANGNSVHVNFTDLSPFSYSAIKQELAKYQYGHFDGMNDIYEFSNIREDIPQAKYVQVFNTMSDAKLEEVFQFIRANFSEGDLMPETYAEARNTTFSREYVSTLVHQQFEQCDSLYWNADLRKAA